MRLLENARYSSFWIIDSLKGGKTKSHYDDIKFILENFNTHESKKRRDNNLLKLLNHVVVSVPFYKIYQSFNSISDFPVVDKILLRESLDDFISEKYKNKPSFKVSTSGSTGTPLIVFQDENKKHRNIADTIYFGERAGYKLGHKLFFIRAWGIQKKNKVTSFLQNIRPINVKKMNNETTSEFINEIRRGNSNNAFIGYTSAFRDICKYLDSINSKPIKASISSMIAMSEPLGEPTKKSVKKYFGVDILSRYSNMENGILSQQIINGGDNFYINWASYYIEILDLENDTPVDYGELGRVVVTDLFNFHMPLIRYDTGDLAVMNIDKNNFNGAPSFLKVEGRRMDTIYDTNGKTMTSVVYELEYFPEFKQFQLIQEGQKKYCVKINIDAVFKSENMLKSILRKFLGEDAIINIEYVDEIPQLSSGKRKLTLNNFRS